jgi:DtxR family Mn-dependent transcriptional regulator
MLKILSKDGLVEYAKYRGVKLTEKGLTEARLTRKRHHVVERFFIEVLGLDHQSAHEEAHRIEHSISDEASVKMCNMLGNPPDCDCQCCISPCKSVSTNGISINTILSDMNEGEKGVISYLKSEDNSTLRNLISMGLSPGKIVTIDSKNKDTGVMIVNAEGAAVAIDDNLSTDYSVQDGELEASMNLLFPLNKPAIPRPVFELTDTVGTDKPNLLVVADSYFTQLRNSTFIEAFDAWEFWVYNRDVQSSNPQHQWKQLDQLLDADKVLDNADIVMAVFTAPMYYTYMFGFPQTAQNLFQNGEISEGAKLQAVIQMIKDNEDWMKAVEKQAEERGLTVEQNLRRNAIYVLEKKKQKGQ